MKKLQIILGAVIFCLLISGLQSCKKSEPAIKNKTQETTVDNTNSQNARMWTTGKQLYAVGHKGATMQASLFKLNSPPGAGVLTPVWYADFFVGTTQVTYVTGLAYVGSNSLIISTGAASNYPNQLLIYATTVTPFNAPTSVTCAGISDIEYNEYDSKLYGIYSNTLAVRISIAGATTALLSPAVPIGSILTGLCNYNGLLSYCVSDNVATNDKFYSYNPISPATPPVLLTLAADWGTGDGGMQFLNGYGWAFLSYNDYKTFIAGASPYTVSGPTLIVGGPYMITDLTSS